MKKYSFAAVTSVLSLILLFSVTAGLLTGSSFMSLSRLWGGFLGLDGFSTERTILFSIRIPRVAAAALAGVGLSLSGVLLQTVTDNDLAGPNIIGINSGAGMAVIVLLAVFPGAFLMLPAAAFVGAFLTTLLIAAVSARAGGRKATIILAGIAVTAIFSGIISFISLVFPDTLVSYNYFTVGGLSGVRLQQLAIPAIIIVTALAASLLLSGRINTLCLGDSMAASLGIKVKSLRLICLAAASAAAASVVSFAGLIGFVGLVVPHIGRKFVGNNTRKLICVSSLSGASLVVLSDLVGRTLFSPSEVPVGIILSFIGAPFFLFLILRKKMK